MTIIETIKKRESVRTYTKEKPEKEKTDEINHFISQIKAPFGVAARIELVSVDLSEKAVKLGTYGFISGASDYLLLIYKDAPLAEEGAAYLFEQVILHCTKLGLGTCWLGGTFNRRDFKKLVKLEVGEKLRIVSPVGYKSDKKRFIESFIKPERRKKNPRKPFGKIFFYKDFQTMLTEDKAGIYMQPLEMVRMGPSANNGQPWRVILDDEVLHFYKTPSFGFDSIDMGIALCHFELTCQELGIKGQFKNLSLPQVKPAQYSVSWISG